MYFLIATLLSFWLLHEGSLAGLESIFSVMSIQSKSTLMSPLEYVHPHLRCTGKKFTYRAAGINASLWNHQTPTVENSLTEAPEVRC